MIAIDDVTRYVEEEMFWLEAAQVVPAPAGQAWQALLQVIMRSGEISTLADVEGSSDGGVGKLPVIEEGSETVINAVLLGGRLTLTTKIIVSKVEPRSYCRMDIWMMNRHFADIDYLIEPVSEIDCRLRYCQGYRYRKSFFGWLGRYVTLNRREIPETVEIFNRWKQYTVAE